MGCAQQTRYEDIVRRLDALEDKMEEFLGRVNRLCDEILGLPDTSSREMLPEGKDV